MAIDRWLLEQHQLGLHPATLRFYTWSPPAISIGYHQFNWPQHWQQLMWRGVPLDMVRRPTGGRAVLHQGDLTYAVVTSGIAGSRVQVYQQICQFLLQGWRSLGIELHYGSTGRGYIHNPSCFSTATGADLVLANGYKLIGSAQLRRKEAVLQHGSIRLQPDTELFTQVFGTQSFSPTQLPLPQRGEALTQSVSEALISAASDCFRVQLVPQPLCEAEWKAILACTQLRVSSQ
jgi:lipoate-protein ligase A